MKRIIDTSITHLQFVFFFPSVTSLSRMNLSRRKKALKCCQIFQVTKVTTRDIQNFTYSNVGHLYTHQCHLINR